jgi:cytochrome c oxidase assembly protein subunit 11
MDQHSSDFAELAARNQRLGLMIMGLVFFMVALSFASVPLYRLFCQVTGFGGPMQGVVVGAPAPGKVGNRVVSVRFNTDTDRNLDWDFGAETRQVSLVVGAEGYVAFHARNLSDKPITGTAVYNVLPEKAAKYFHKTQCFCFGEQHLNPGQSVNMPVLFYVDPKMNDDPNMDDVESVTLSYTFYQTGTTALDRAIDDFQR